MNNSNTQTITIQNVINSYQMLESPDPELRYQANRFLIGISMRDEAWQIAQKMLTDIPDLKFQLLGAQILYQKVGNQIHNLAPSARNELRQFVFTKLCDTNITFGPTIDKLASIGALIGVTSCMVGQGWENLIDDIIGFMGQSQHNLKSGLYVLERIPEQLRLTNRLNLSKKNAIINRLLQKQKELASVFSTILDMNDDLMIKKCMQAMQSWAKSRFNFLMHTELIKKVLVQSLLSFAKFQSGIIMIVQTIKGAQINKSSTSLSEWQPDKELTKYQPQQIQSIKLLILFITENQQNFLSQSVQSQYLDMYTDIIKQSLLSFGFLIKEDIGFKLLDIIMTFTQSSDLRTSHGTFEFWMDFSDKMLKCKVDVQIKNYFRTYMEKLFQIVSKKITVESESLLDDPDLKEDVTIDDDANSMSFAEYRKQSTTLYQYIYNYFHSFTKSPQLYFDKCFQFVGAEANGQLGKGTELALFCIKSVSQSLISQQDTEYICKFLSFIIDKGTNVYARIVVEVFLLIRDCTRQIKKDNNLCLKALNYSLYFIKDEGICYYAAQSFKTLMQTLTSVSEPSIVQNMLSFYSGQKFPNDQIIDKIIEGIFSTITKMNSPEVIQHYLKQFIQIVVKRFQVIHSNVKQNDNRPYLLPVLQMKTILDNFQGMQNNFKNAYRELHSQILSVGLKMISIVIPYAIKQKQKYVKFNQLGLSCSIYKLALKLCYNDITQEFLNILDMILAVVNKETIIDMYPVLELLCSTMTYFVPRNCPNLNAWLLQRILYIDNFFLEYMKDIHSADVDVIRCFYQIQESLVLYNSQIFLQLNNYNTIFQLALWILRHLNQQKMQRKVVNFLYICCQMTEVFKSSFQKVVETIIGSIPIVNNITACNLGKMLVLISQHLPNIQQILLISLRSNPYEGLSETMTALLTKLMMLLIRPHHQIQMVKRQRRMIMMIKDLNQLAKSGQLPNQVIQMQFRYVNWAKNKGGDD